MVAAAVDVVAAAAADLVVAAVDVVAAPDVGKKDFFPRTEVVISD